MLFSNETVYLEVLIGGYTDRPWYFKTEHMGRNALSCQVSYSNKETGREFVMWNELLQTEELGAIRDGLEKVLAGAEEKFVFHSEYETFAIAIGTLEDGFEVIVQVQNFGGNVWERFYLGKESLGEVLEYLRFCCEKYPIRFFEDEFI